MRYKGVKIPTYEEAIRDMEMNKLDEDPKLGSNVVVQVREVNIIVCSKEEAENIKEMDGVNGINKKIEDVCKDYIDNVMDGALTLIDSVHEMEDEVNDPDSGKAFKDFTKLNPSQEVVPDNVETVLPIGAVDEKMVMLEKEEHFTPLKEVTELSKPDTGIQLTDEQVAQINKLAEEANKNNADIQKLQSLPSNNGVEERKPEDIKETGETKLLNVSVDPNTGEHKILGEASPDEITESFEDFYERISNSDIDFTNADKEITEEEASQIQQTDKKKLFSMLGNLDVDGISSEAIQQLIGIANRKIAKENFSVYNVLPDEFKKLIDQYAVEAGIPTLDKRYKEIRHTVADMLLDEFISNINIDRIQHDFNSELETMFSKASSDLGEEIVGYSEAKIAKYREAAEKMEDQEKKEKLLNVLDRIHEAYDLSELKEFAKRCKIKPFDLEKPDKYFKDYQNKYSSSNYNIYSIEMARPILFRNLTKDGDVYTDKDINAFFIAFCKQTLNMKADNVLDHAYMYYVIYNIVLADLNRSEKTKHVSDVFLGNVKEVIANLKERNAGILK